MLVYRSVKLKRFSVTCWSRLFWRLSPFHPPEKHQIWLVCPSPGKTKDTCSRHVSEQCIRKNIDRRVKHNILKHEHTKISFPPQTTWINSYQPQNSPVVFGRSFWHFPQVTSKEVLPALGIPIRATSFIIRSSNSKRVLEMSGAWGPCGLRWICRRICSSHKLLATKTLVEKQ